MFSVSKNDFEDNFIAAEESENSLYNYIGGADARVLPIPMMNILNGGSHADNSIDFQEFMVMPVGATSFSEAMQMGGEVFQHLGQIAYLRGLQRGFGDVGENFGTPRNI